jgi:hypothetical protein
MRDDIEPPAFVAYPDLYLIGVELFNRADYFESHEAWERQWREPCGAERNFYKGLIHISVGLCHLYNGNGLGARKLYRSGRAYLEPFLPGHLGLDLQGFLSEVDRCFAVAAAAGPDEPVWLDPDRAPAIRLDPPPRAWPVIPDWVYDEESAE